MSNPAEFIPAYKASSSGVLILDVRMPDMSGLELQSKLLVNEIYLPIIFISGHASVPIAVEAMKQGAVEFLTKPFNDQVLLDSIHRAIKQDQVRRLRCQEVGSIRDCLERLTRREKEVLELVVEAKSSKVIAVELGISYKTVELHRSRIIEKMQVASTLELAQLINKVSAFELESAGVNT